MTFSPTVTLLLWVADGNPPTYETVLDFDRDSSVTRGTAVEDSLITDNAVSLQDGATTI